MIVSTNLLYLTIWTAGTGAGFSAGSSLKAPIENIYSVLLDFLIVFFLYYKMKLDMQ